MKGLYIHIPFCVRKCKYCDFVSCAVSEEEKTKYISALLCEAKEYYGEEIDSVFIGGGTPSTLCEDDITRLLSGIGSIFNISSDAEFTVEVNPDSVTAEKILAFTSGGVNRISMGVQSFSDSELKMLGRVHSSDIAKSAIEIISKQVPNFNLDIMTGIPNQTKETLLDTLTVAVSYSPTHISAYSLIIEEGTPFYDAYRKGALTLPTEEADREMYALTGKFLNKYGYSRYEISNYAKDGFACRHNLKYWNCDEYIGLGTAAHSYVVNERFFNTSDISQYIDGNFGRTSEFIDFNGKISEFMIMGLRKSDGVSYIEFKKRFGKDLSDVFGDVIEKYVKMGFLEILCDNLRFSDKGIDVSNTILCEFV